MLLKTSRRTFLKGLTLSGVAGSLGVWSFNARSSLSLPVAASLQGTQFDLTIGETAVNITGSERQAKTINGGLPLFTSSRLISIAVRSPRINPQLHLLDPHLTPKSLAYAPVRERFFSHISNFNSEEVEVSDQHCHVTPGNYKNTFFLL